MCVLCSHYYIPTLPCSPPLNPTQADEFSLQWSDLGDLREIVVGHDGCGRSPLWHLEQVEITETKTGQVGVEREWSSVKGTEFKFGLLIFE